MNSKKVNIFSYSCFIIVGAIAFIQDCMGLDAWIEFISNNWTNLSPFWGASFIIYGIYGLFKEKL